jgi:dsRNA-specific ribonuclease
MPQPSNCIPLKTKSNERLEFLGDGVLECVTKYYLYRRFPKENEGFMTEKKIAIVKNESIGKFAIEMGLHKWFIISKHAEEKRTRTNLKKLGCLFEAFIGALFLDFNKISIHDDDKWFDNVFVTGPGFQMAQKFIEAVFERHVDWVALIKNDDNYKNILQVKIQKEFKTTPDYLEINHDPENGYTMGVYLCLGKEIYHTDFRDAIKYSTLHTFANIRKHYEEKGYILVHFASGTHKIKKKAEQMACEFALQCMKPYDIAINE